jgi:NADH-quinone oxidoreductase subunit A
VIFFTKSAAVADVRGNDTGCLMILASVTPYLNNPAGVEPAFELSAYYPIFLYLGVCILVPVGALILTHTIGPRNKTAVKQMPYESGMDPIGSAYHKFDIKYYLIAILFLVFDVELLFLYPWAVIAYRDGGQQTAWKAEFGGIVFLEMLIFIATLAIAYIYAWRRKVFEWR